MGFYSAFSKLKKYGAEQGAEHRKKINQQMENGEI